MMTEQNHIICKQKIEISFDDLDDAFGVQDRIAELFYERIQPRMESLLDEMFDKTHVISFERIEIDCGVLPAKNWEDEWIECTLRNLKDQLRQVDKKEKATVDSSNEFLFYLQHGHLPWNSRISSVEELEKELIVNETLIAALREMINEHPIAAKRLAHKFSNGFINKLIEKLSEKSEYISEALTELSEELSEEIISGPIFKEAILTALSTATASRKELKEMILAKMSHQSKEPDKLSTTKKDLKTFSNNKELEGIYINNAGIIILHPFLPLFFDQLNFTENGKWINEKTQHKAALVLEYLTSGVNEIKEFDLSLPKIISGLNPETVITEEEIVEDDIINACDELISEVIAHWAALKNTGIESFRHTFLQRKGKLSIVDNGWLLQVERQGVDILLGSLPWGIGVIKLPWMNEILFTEWA